MHAKNITGIDRTYIVEKYTEDKCYTKDKSSSPPLYQTA